MTYKELTKIPFRFVGHLSMEDEHTISYISEDGRIGFCDHFRMRDGRPKGKGYRHWRIDGKVYKTKEKFLAALSEFNPKIIPIRKN